MTLHIAGHISVVKFKERLITVTVVWFKFIVLFKFAGILNFEVEIKMNLIIGLTFLTNSVSDFDCLSLAIAFLCKMFIFLLVQTRLAFSRCISLKTTFQTNFLFIEDIFF